jgi:hypothetical protein
MGTLAPAEVCKGSPSTTLCHPSGSRSDLGCLGQERPHTRGEGGTTWATVQSLSCPRLSGSLSPRACAGDQGSEEPTFGLGEGTPRRVAAFGQGAWAIAVAEACRNHPSFPGLPRGRGGGGAKGLDEKNHLMK